MNETFSAPVRASVKVPAGQILVNKKWQGSQLGMELVSRSSAVYSDALGYVDFFPAESCPVIYVTESEQIMTTKSYVQKMYRLFEHYNSKGVVIADQTCNSSFQEIQDLATIELELTTIPICTQAELPQLLTQMSYVEGKLPNNPFKTRCSSTVEENMESQQVSLLKLIPGVGETFAVKMLKAYGHPSAVSLKSKERLGYRLGDQVSHAVHTFFHKNVSLNMKSDH